MGMRSACGSFKSMAWQAHALAQYRDIFDFSTKGNIMPTRRCKDEPPQADTPSLMFCMSCAFPGIERSRKAGRSPTPSGNARTTPKKVSYLQRAMNELHDVNN